MTTFVLAVVSAMAISGAAWAQCADTPPVKIAIAAGEAAVDDLWLEANLVGRTVQYEDSSEEYRRDRSYVFRAGRSVFRAPAFRFYPDGTRCIGYEAAPRYDRYVLSGDVLTLINLQGTRFPAWVSR